jgi:hypothetical protein
VRHVELGVRGGAAEDLGEVGLVGLGVAEARVDGLGRVVWVVEAVVLGRGRDELQEAGGLAALVEGVRPALRLEVDGAAHVVGTVAHAEALGRLGDEVVERAHAV